MKFYDMKKGSYASLLVLIILFSFSETNAQSNIIGNPIKIGNLEVSQHNYSSNGWDDAKKMISDLGSGWRLPTVEELTTLFQNKDKIDNISTLTSYWTSKVDVDAAFAVAGDVTDGGSFKFEITHKSYGILARPVRNSINNSAPSYYVGEDQKKRNNLSVLRFTSYDCGELVKSINSKGKNPRYNDQPKLYLDEVVGPTIGEYILQHYSNATESEFKSLINQAIECVSISLNNVKPNTNNSAVQNCNINFQIPTLPFKYVDNRVLCIYCGNRYIPYSKIDVNEYKKGMTLTYVSKKIDEHCEEVGADNNHKASHIIQIGNLCVKKGYFKTTEDAVATIITGNFIGKQVSNYFEGITSMLNILQQALGSSTQNNQANEFTIKLYDNNNTKFCTREHEDRYNRRY